MSEAIENLRAMLLIRAFEDCLAARKDHGFQLLSSGEEAVSVGLASALNEHDQLLTGGRSIGPALARGVKPEHLMAELLARTGGVNRGRAGRGHFSDAEHGFFGAHAVVAGNITIAAGVALARKLDNDPGIVAILFGDGASAAGAHRSCACGCAPHRAQLRAGRARSARPTAPSRAAQRGARAGRRPAA